MKLKDLKIGQTLVIAKKKPKVNKFTKRKEQLKKKLDALEEAHSEDKVRGSEYVYNKKLLKQKIDKVAKDRARLARTKKRRK